MPFSQALYYPWIDIQDEAWLKTSLLYWDSVRTIVPESIDEPYSLETSRILKDAGFLVPLRVRSGMQEIEELSDDVMTYLNTNEGVELLLSGTKSKRNHIHLDKLPYRLGRLANIHPEKLPYEIRNLISNIASPSHRGGDWLEVDESFGLFYMTLLANRLAERVDAGLLTPLPTAERLAVSARLDSQLQGIVPFDHGWRRSWREYEAYGHRRNMPRTLSPGMLSQLAIEKIQIEPSTTVDDLLKFKSNHKDELAQFRSKIEQIASTIKEDLPEEALRQRISDLYNTEVEPAINNLKKALDGRRIKWIGEGLLKVAFLSAGSSAMLVSAGLSVPTALLAGAGISLVVSGTMYNVDKTESLRNNPYTYLLSLKKELG